MTACGNSKDQEAQTNVTIQENEEIDTQETTDTTAEETNQSDTSVQTVEKYPNSYDAAIDQGQEEQSSGARPELSNIEDYDVVFLGFPLLHLLKMI